LDAKRKKTELSMRNSYRNLAGKQQDKRKLGMPRRKWGWGGSITVGVKETLFARVVKSWTTGWTIGGSSSGRGREFFF